MTIDFKASRDVIIRTEKFAEAVQFYRVPPVRVLDVGPVTVRDG
jgi:hypothetical protein